MEYWGPGIAPGRLWPSDSTGPVLLKARAAMRIEGRIVSATDSPVAGLPVWMRISRSVNSGYQSYGTRGRATPLERPWLPWAVTDSAGRFSIAGLSPSECEVEVRAPGFPAARSERLEGEPGAVLETTVTLRAGAALDLRVTDPGGNPLPGATIDLFRSAGKGGGPSMAIAMGYRGARGDPELTAFTDEEGRGHMVSVPVGAVRLRLSRPGSVSRTIDAIEVPAEGIDIGDQVLEPGVTLTGTTLGPDGEPVGEAEVALERNPQVPFFRVEVTSDEDGRFSIPDLEPSGEVYLQARAEGLVPEAPLKVELPPEGEIEVPMAEERILEGFVLDARSDSPVEGASLSLSFQREMSFPGEGSYGRFGMSVGKSQTDASGRFLFDGLWDGEFEMHVSAEGMRRVQQTVMIGAANPEPVVIRLDPGLELRGRVETADGEPAAGVAVTASPASQSRAGGMTDTSRTQSDADGRFHFDALGPGTQWVRARSEDGQSAQATADAGQPDEVVLRFPRGGVIRGTVFGPDGSPVAGARVIAYSRDVFQSVSDEIGVDGRFGLTDVGPGSWTVWASAEGLAGASEDVEVPEGETVTVDLHLERGATVIGEILGLSASELESCMVRVDGGGRASLTADGAFRIDGVPSGERQVVAIEMTTRRSRSVGVVVPESGESEPVVVDFAAGLTVYGRVLRNSTGVPGLTVSVHGVVAAASGETVSGPDGSWRVEGLEPGEYQIAAHSRSGAVLAGDHVLLEADTELDLVVSSGSVIGRVLEADTERPIEGATVTVTGSSLPPVQRAATSDAAGAFEVSDLGDGDYTVQAKARGRMPARQNVTVLDGAAHDVTLLLEGDTTTVLVVREADGLSASRISIQSLGGGILGPSIWSLCSADGRCEVNDLPRGRWTLLVQGRGSALVVADVPHAEIPVRLRVAGELKITAPDDESGASWQVRLSEAATGIVVPVHQWYNPGRGEWVPVRASGLDLRLPEGAWRIEAYAPDGTMSTRDAIVPGGGSAIVILE
jgi:protocatechuate 3,4-dioxygenase beta subunit